MVAVEALINCDVFIDHFREIIQMPGFVHNTLDLTFPQGRIMPVKLDALCQSVPKSAGIIIPEKKAIPFRMIRTVSWQPFRLG